MSQDPIKPFLSRVTDSLQDLHPSERKLADLVLDFPRDMVGYTATELAELATVSNATVSRFVRRLGYASFEEARRALRDEQRGGTAILRMSTQPLSAGGALEAHFESSKQNLDLTYGALDSASLDGLAKSLIKAQRVWFVGFRAGQPLANYLGWQTAQVLDNVTVLPRAGETLAESLVSLTADDVVVVFALRRMSKLVTQVADVVRDAQAGLAVIEDRPHTIPDPVEWRFSSVTSAPGPLMNHVSVMAVCNLIAARVIELSGTTGRSRMVAIEKHHQRFDEL